MPTAVAVDFPYLQICFTIQQIILPVTSDLSSVHVYTSQAELIAKIKAMSVEVNYIVYNYI